MQDILFDIVVVGAGPVGLLCAYLARLCELKVFIFDKSSTPLQVGRADALNARSLQLIKLIDLFDELYPLGKPCNTSSVWSDGNFVSRQSTWWEALEGCFHKHFLMIGQSFLEQALDKKLTEMNSAVKRNTTITNLVIDKDKDVCLTTLSTGEVIKSRFVIGADGSRSFVRQHLQVPFEITRPKLIWAVLDGVIESDFQKVPEIIVFQADTSDVAWIPREGNIDRFYVRMDTKDYTLEDTLAKINRAMAPHQLKFKEIVWFSHFSVKESVAEHFLIEDKVFLAGDACHIHSVNGGQGLNTGLADAFNLVWKINLVVKFGASLEVLKSYEEERKPVAKSVIETSGALVRSTKYSEGERSHAMDYVKIVEKKAGNITGMGICYGDHPLHGKRFFDFNIFEDEEEVEGKKKRMYDLLDYRHFSLVVFGGEEPVDLKLTSLPSFVKVIEIYDKKVGKGYWTNSAPYSKQILLVRPDSYIASSSTLSSMSPIQYSLGDFHFGVHSTSKK